MPYGDRSLTEGNMRPNHARRKAILDFIVRNDGRAHAHEIHAAIVAAGFHSVRANIARYCRPLIDAGLLTIVGKGMYRDAKAHALGVERYLDLLPYPTRTEGRILLHMLTHRFVRASELIAHLREAGVMTNRQLVYTALWQLGKEGYVTRVSQGTYTMTRKTLELVGLSDILDDRPIFEGPWGRVLWPHITELLGLLGPTRQRVLFDHVKRRGFPVERYHVYAAIRQLRGHGTVEKRSRGLYALKTPAPAANAAS